MDDTLFQALLKTLSPLTLARLVVDLETAGQDWATYPAEAPPEPLRAGLVALLAIIDQVGAERAQQEGLDFARLTAAARQASESIDWSAGRDQQERDNWFSDFD
jgi:hypothetical protein